MSLAKVRSLIRDIPDFPKPGIIFKDITPILKEPAAITAVMDGLEAYARERGANLVAAPESRGFLFGMGLATRLGVGFVPLRKPGKLPWRTRSAAYDLEYGQDHIEIHEDAAGPGHRVMLVDDLLATGGTMAACGSLIEELGGTVAGCAFVIELAFLEGRHRIQKWDIHSLIQFG